MAGILPVFVISAIVAVVRVAVPATPAGSAFSAWLEAFNAADREKLQEVFKRFREPRPADRALGFRRATGGFELKKVLASTPTRIRVLVQERDSDQMAEGSSRSSRRRPTGSRAGT